MSEDDLKNLKELKSKNNPRVLTMYFEDGGETFVIPYDDYDSLQQENQQLKKQLKQRDEVIDEAIEYLLTATLVDTSKYHQRNTLLKILQKYKGDNNE